MFKRDWLNGFIFGIVAGFLLTPALIFAAIAFSGAPEYLGYTNASHQSGNHATPQDQRWWLIARVVYMDDTAAQWIMTFATIFAAYLLLRTIWATQKMAAETTRIGEAQVRAYVSVDDVSLGASSDNPNGPTHFININAVNSGQSPALAFAWSAELCIGPDGRGIVWKLPKPKHWEIELPAGHKGWLIPVGITDNKQAFTGENQVAQVKVSIFYRDVFQKPFSKTFIFGGGGYGTGNTFNWKFYRYSEEDQ